MISSGVEPSYGQTSAVRFASGEGLLWVSARAAVLFQAPPSEIEKRLRVLLADPISFVEGVSSDVVLSELSADSFAVPESFVFVEFEPEGVRFFIRGSAAVSAYARTEDVDLDAIDVKTWREAFVPSCERWQARLAADSPESETAYTVYGPCLVPAGKVGWSASDHRQEVASLARLSWRDAVVPSADTDGKAASGAADTYSAVVEDDVSIDGSVGEDREQPAASISDGSLRRPSTPHSAHTLYPEQTGPSPQRSGAQGADYESLFGRTTNRLIQDAAVSEPLDDEAPELGDLADEPIIDHVDPVDHRGSAADGNHADSIEALPAPALITSIPWGNTPEVEPAGSARAQASGAIEGDHDGQTISRAELIAMADDDSIASTVADTTVGGASVRARVCSQGHLNPPTSVECVFCGGELPRKQVTRPRPTLGSITFSTGDVVNLIRPVVLGRNPKIEGELGTEIPQVLKFADGMGISRDHASIRLEQWHVLLADLHSTNGTFLTPRGRPQFRVSPGKPEMITDGAKIQLGDEVFGTYSRMQ